MKALGGKFRRLHFHLLAVEVHSRMRLSQPGIKDESSRFRRDQRSLRQGDGALSPLAPRLSALALVTADLHRIREALPL